MPKLVLKRTESQAHGGGEMKRTATTLVLLAGFGGSGCVNPATQNQNQPATGGYGTVTRGKQVDTVQGSLGEPVMAARGPMPGAPQSVPQGAVRQAAGPGTLFGPGTLIHPAMGVTPATVTAADGCTNCVVPGVGGGVILASGSSYGPPPGYDGQVAYDGPPPGYGAVGPYGPKVPNMPNMPKRGIVPTPTMGPPGAVAAVGAYQGGMGRAAMANGRSSINFTGPAGMKVTWQLPDGSFNDEANALTAPKEYNFLQAQVYRLRLTSILPDYPGKSFYPTLDVAPASPKSLTFLAHSSVPITFSPDDFAQARAGNLVVKVVYLPDPANQDFSSIVGAEEVVSTRLDPGADPVAEAQRRGTILAVIRMGNIDLENRVSPSMTAPPPGAMMPPGAALPSPRPVVPPGGMGMQPLAPANPPGTASVKPSATRPALPLPLPLPPSSPPSPSPSPSPSPAPAAPVSLLPAVPTDLPPAAVNPVAPVTPAGPMPAPVAPMPPVGSPPAALTPMAPADLPPAALTPVAPTTPADLPPAALTPVVPLAPMAPAAPGAKPMSK